MNILVTGAGALLGQGILRSLNQIDNNLIIHTCDPNWRSGGHWLGHYAHSILPADDKDYIKSLYSIIKDHNIRVLFVGTDVELPVIAERKAELEEDFKIKIVISNKKVIDIANNKWLTAQFLEENNFPYPYSVLTSDENGIDLLKQRGAYPYFAKPVDGARSKGIRIIESEETINELTSFPNNLVIQEYIPDDEGEFTSGCVVVEGKAVAVVTLKRDLRDGNTYRAYYEKEFSKYDATIKKIAETLGVDGPCNFQFRIRNGEPVIFEINARFSGTTPLRSFFGFNEVEALLNYYLNKKNISEPELIEGEVLRVWSDIFITKEEVQRNATTKDVANPQCTYYPFKKF